MAYIQDQYPFSTEHPQQPMRQFQQPAQFPLYQAPQHTTYDGYYNPYAQGEYADLTQHASMQEEFEEGQENLTRPRLTKDQVDVLESQFQAHPKPNGMVKRQLAQQTRLTLPRVANWFQNRRAKAKQVKKQEEFENAQVGNLPEACRSESSLPHRPAPSSHTESAPPATRERSSTDVATTASAHLFPSAQSSHDDAKEASWASLQRALHSAQASRQQQTEQLEQMCMPPPAIPRQIQTQLVSPPLSHDSSLSSSAPISAYSEWNTSTPWSSAHPSEHSQFDFGFEQSDDQISSGSDNTPTDTNDAILAQRFNVDSEWNNVIRQQVISAQQVPTVGQINSSMMQPMTFQPSRRGSTSDELTTDFNTFDLTGTPPVPAHTYIDPMRKAEGGEIDLAARRKRPRPAALGSAALRSRSYGALSSVSPTMRANTQMPHAVRHVKSSGHSLNVRYAGIRKPSPAQRSPLNVSSFTEAEALKRLIHQQSMLTPTHEGSEGLTGQITPLMSPEIAINNQQPISEQYAFPKPEQPNPLQCPPQSANSYYSAFTSPPVTPFQSEFFMAQQNQSLMPPVSAPAQYATFPDYTPPYSAGPLTTSSWSDAPLTSPDIPNFQLMAHMPPMGYAISQDMSTGQYQHFILSPDYKPETSPTLSEQKKTEFFIHEFPGQKEEHAHVAQQLAQQKPKNYVFANATPNDY